MASLFLTRSVRPAFTVFLRPFLTSSSAYSASSGEIVIDKTDKSVDTTGDDQQTGIAILNGIPEWHLKNRTARIFFPSKNAMQSGTQSFQNWRLEFENMERWENPLMGWASTGDPLSNMTLDFTSKEEAIAFAESHGFKYELEEKQEKKIIPKSYGANFSWNKNTRVSTK
ncbi:NADH dehydrogenase [ubiquinone] iron-sulfur protein 4, mitochondrial [Exaiptasia diaphana]|uniref:NADH dehydrogenase [ubiquinone] iron-sulfur protein 4, mitochondrial n=1 Tax=Exaiptasia diaphana TaxID=2652724 RepID=A0A913XIC6_EXADI|nr:NADH dehydrogenase [ubiquinone] iron-sulfur protein 4, mitochondrial [Exaiptasia diaphana]KXJ25972.1 NADH dehydrogenase [ubiquinone] iron-sulfur protein 4, mitochondrial [Exaiptasia diaphana]